MIPPVVASDRGAAQTARVLPGPRGVVGPLFLHGLCERNRLERLAAAGDSPLREAWSGIAAS